MSKSISVSHFPITKDLQNRLPSQVKSWEGKKILIVGDVGVDEYIMGEVRRISPEAPVPVVEVQEEDTRLGLSANVAQNIQALGGQALMVCVAGDDSGSETLKHLLKKSHVSPDWIVTDTSRPTTRKARVMAKHHHVVRVDYETRKLLSVEIEQQVLGKIDQALDICDAVILQDYAKGVVTPTLAQALFQRARLKKKQVFVDPHRLNEASFYAGCDLLKPNFDEALALSGLSYDDLRDHPDRIVEVGRALQKQTGARQVVMTRGKDGMTIFDGEVITQVPTFAKQVFDVTGAGDTVIATLALGLSRGLPLAEACVLANFAAGVVVAQVGCVPCRRDELIEATQAEDL